MSKKNNSNLNNSFFSFLKEKEEIEGKAYSSSQNKLLSKNKHAKFEPNLNITRKTGMSYNIILFILQIVLMKLI